MMVKYEHVDINAQATLHVLCISIAMSVYICMSVHASMHVRRCIPARKGVYM